MGYSHIRIIRKPLCSRKLASWDSGTSNCHRSFGQVYEYWVPGHLELYRV